MEIKEPTVEPELLESIKELGLDTSRMTFDELAEATGFTKSQVAKTLRNNSMPYVSARLSKRSTAPNYTPAAEHTPAPETGQPGAESPSFSSQPTSTDMLLERQDQTRRLRTLNKIRKLGAAKSSMTIAEIAEATNLHYLEVQRVVDE